MHTQATAETILDDLKAIAETLPGQLSPQERISFFTRPLPGSSSKDPITLVCEGRTGTLTAAIENLHKPVWKRILSKLSG